MELNDADDIIKREYAIYGQSISAGLGIISH